jgi:protein TonB
VRDVQVLSGHPLLVQAALAAVREWRYRPTELNHEIVEVETEITVNFVLSRSQSYKGVLVFQDALQV